MKKIIEKFGIIFLAVIIFITTFLIGTPLKSENVFIINIAVNLISIIYYISCIIKKEKIITNKLDAFFILLTFSSTIPLIFRSYASLSETIYMIIKYFSVLNIYFLAKNECGKDKQNIGTIITCIIIGTLGLCFIGLDEINSNELRFFKDSLNYEFVLYDEERIGSLFSYPNTMAIVAAIGIFLTIGEIIKNKNNNLKYMYLLVLAVMGITLILTYSRLVYIVFAFTLLIYLLLYLRKYDIKSFFLKRKRNFIIGIITIVVLIISYIAIGLNLDSELVIESKYQKILYTVKPNEDYIFKFKVTSPGIKVFITEKNKFFDSVNTSNYEYSELNNEDVEIKIHTLNETSVIYLNIENLSEQGVSKITESSLNNEKLILKHKLLPTNVIDKIESISLNNKSAWERFTFVGDALELIKDNWLFGYGGEAWNNLQYKTQDYNYGAREVHNYIIQAFLEFGIIGFVATILIIVWFVKKIIEDIKNKNYDIRILSIEVAILALIIHSILDFNMSFMYVLMLYSIMLAILSSQEEKIHIKYNRTFTIILIITSLISFTISSLEKYYIESTRFIVEGKEYEKLELFENMYKILPFNTNLQERLYLAYKSEEKNNIDKMIEIKRNNIDSETYSEENVNLSNVLEYVKLLSESNSLTVEEQEYIYEHIVQTEGTVKYQQYEVIKRWQNMYNLTEYINDANIKEQLIKEFNLYKEYVLDYTNCRYDKNMLTHFKNEIKNIEYKIY